MPVILSLTIIFKLCLKSKADYYYILQTYKMLKKMKKLPTHRKANIIYKALRYYYILQDFNRYISKPFV